jgi:hypothetical protein
LFSQEYFAHLPLEQSIAISKSVGPTVAQTQAQLFMGEHNVEQNIDEQKSHAFMRALLEDLRALAFMLEDGRVETGVTRIGAEQEMFLIDSDLRPASVSAEVLIKPTTHDSQRKSQSSTSKLT